MMEQTTSVYFDGISSVSQEVTLTFNAGKNIFFFETPDNQIHSWDIDAIRFNQKQTCLELLYGDEPTQIIKIENERFILAITSYINENGKLGWYQKLLNLGIKIHLAMAFLILGLVFLCYMYAIPWVGEKSVFLIPESYDATLGAAVFEESTFLSTLDAKKTKTLNLFAKELNLKNHKTLKFFVIESDIKNAFALPDGSIVVYTGILDLMSNYEELVGLIGHEVAHVNHRHSMKMLCRNLSGYIFVSTVLGDANGVMSIIGENANALQSLSFSREFEREADVEGFKIVTKNKVNPNGMATLFKQLKEVNPLEIPEFLSSHPITGERIQYINELIKKEPYQVAENPKLARLFQELKN